MPPTCGLDWSIDSCRNRAPASYSAASQKNASRAMAFRPHRHAPARQAFPRRSSVPGAARSGPLLYSLATRKGNGGRAMLDNIKKDTQTRMQKSVDALKHELMRLRTGRASSALIEPLKVSYYGNDTPVMQVANVAIEARAITITPYEKNMVAAVEKAILASDLGLTPTTVGQVIRINLPPLTEERRKELSKHVAHEGENAKVAVRNVRRDALHQIKELLKDKKISEDEESRAEDEIQKFTDKFVKDVDGVVKAKEDELMAM
jgi:ribosome recycling factor